MRSAANGEVIQRGVWRVVVSERITESATNVSYTIYGSGDRGGRDREDTRKGQIRSLASKYRVCAIKESCCPITRPLNLGIIGDLYLAKLSM